MLSLIIQGVPTQILSIFSSKEEYLLVFWVSPSSMSRFWFNLEIKTDQIHKITEFIYCVYFFSEIVFHSRHVDSMKEKAKMRGIFFSQRRKNRQGRKNFFTHTGWKKYLPTTERELKYPIRGKIDFAWDSRELIIWILYVYNFLKYRIALYLIEFQ